MRPTLNACASVLMLLTAKSAFAGPAHAGPCNDLSGYYGKRTAIVVGQDGKKVNITVASGRPNAYGTCSDKQLSVNFPDDGLVKGVFDGKTIKWSNNTVWAKQ